MTSISKTQPVASNGIFNFVFAIEKMFAERKVYTKTVRELNRLDERGLEDLGLCRADIEGVARRVAVVR